MPNNNSRSERPLTGKALLAKLKTLDALNKTEKAKACGYVTHSSRGKERAQLNQFMNAVLEAQGIQLDGPSGDNRGRSLTYRVSVQQNGHIIIGPGYTRKMNLKPGDRFEITLGRQSITLSAMESENPDVGGFEDAVHGDEEFDDDEID